MCGGVCIYNETTAEYGDQRNGTLIRVRLIEREAAKKSFVFSGPTTKRGGG